MLVSRAAQMAVPLNSDGSESHVCDRQHWYCHCHRDEADIPRVGVQGPRNRRRQGLGNYRPDRSPRPYPPVRQ